MIKCSHIELRVTQKRLRGFSDALGATAALMNGSQLNCLTIAFENIASEKASGELELWISQGDNCPMGRVRQYKKVLSYDPIALYSKRFTPANDKQSVLISEIKHQAPHLPRATSLPLPLSRLIAPNEED